MKFKQYINESISISTIKQGIKKAVKENPKRLGHGHTAYTSFWIEEDGNILTFKDYKKIKTTAVNVHSHSSASGKDDKGFETFSGGDIAVLRWMQQYNIGDTIALISALGQLHVLKGGNWKKKDERYEVDKQYESKTELLKELAKQRNAKFTTTKWK